MDIKELEFIRDFTNDLYLLSRDLANVTIVLGESGDELEKSDCFYHLAINSLWSLTHQSQFLLKTVEMFKEQVDRNYWSEWRKLNPEMDEDYDTHNKLEKIF